MGECDETEVSGSARRFVLHKNQTAGVHYDLRLEVGGAMKCWAIPRGPSLDSSEKRLAVRTEDHPLELASFEGPTFRNDYGSGTVIIWDRGLYRSAGDFASSMREGRIHLELLGEKLKGGWLLVRMPRKRGRENWLFWKEEDEFARGPGGRDILVEQPRSVVSNLTVEAMSIRELSSLERRKGKPDEENGAPRSRSFLAPDG
jgi:bifunctional non-homologous end joining protein LigD